MPDRDIDILTGRQTLDANCKKLLKKKTPQDVDAYETILALFVG